MSRVNSSTITPWNLTSISLIPLFSATTVRTTANHPLLSEEPETYEAIRDILRKKKLWEFAALEAARAKQQAIADAEANVDLEAKAKLEEQEREAAVQQVQEGRGQLEKLSMQRTELENREHSEFRAKIDKFTEESLQEAETVMKQLKQQHDREVKLMIEEAQRVNESDERELAAKLCEMDEDKKRKADVAVSGEGTSQCPKKQKTEKSTIDTESSAEADGELYQDLFGESPVKTNSKPKAEESDDETDLFGDISDEDDKPTNVPRSVKKKEELKALTEEVNDLNKTKSQMIWLLKQVITAETKLKMKQTMMGKK